MQSPHFRDLPTRIVTVSCYEVERSIKMERENCHFGGIQVWEYPKNDPLIFHNSPKSNGKFTAWK